MEVRRALDADYSRMLLLEEAAAHDIPWTDAAFQRCLEAGYPGWVLEDEAGQIVGFILISAAGGECHILNVVVDPRHQRKGYGKKLLDTAMAWAKEQGSGIAYLEVRRSNVRAIRLYRHLNFKQVGERSNYYPGKNGKREDALIFARDIGIE